MIVVSPPSTYEPVPHRRLLDDACRLLEAASRIGDAEFASPGMSTRSDTSFRLPDGAILRRTEYDARRTGVYDRTLELRGRGDPIRMIMQCCSRSRPASCVPEARRSILAMARAMKRIADASARSHEDLPDDLRSAACCILVRVDEAVLGEDRLIGIAPPPVRAGTLRFGTPWTRTRVFPHGRSSHYRTPDASRLPQVVRMETRMNAVLSPPTLEVRLDDYAVQYDPATTGPVERLRQEAAFCALKAST